MKGRAAAGTRWLLARHAVGHDQIYGRKARSPLDEAWILPSARHAVVNRAHEPVSPRHRRGACSLLAATLRRFLGRRRIGPDVGYSASLMPRRVIALGSRGRVIAAANLFTSCKLSRRRYFWPHFSPEVATGPPGYSLPVSRRHILLTYWRLQLMLCLYMICWHIV